MIVKVSINKISVSVRHKQTVSENVFFCL